MSGYELHQILIILETINVEVDFYLAFNRQ